MCSHLPVLVMRRAAAFKPTEVTILSSGCHGYAGERELTRYDLPKLVYLEAVLKEAMRVKPVGPVVLRCAIDDDVIEGFPVPAGTQIILNLARIHRREAAFDHPNSFQPERFLDKVSKSNHPL